eukprot:GHVL01037495.1.p1 GENE.GHVL01037495.1~~GHVL01037495.1.p1  ORF type:complete len:364 (+),score=41.25 GHVL01037495.1:492-1583(+)
MLTSSKRSSDQNMSQNIDDLKQSDDYSHLNQSRSTKSQKDSTNHKKFKIGGEYNKCPNSVHSLSEWNSQMKSSNATLTSFEQENKNLALRQLVIQIAKTNNSEKQFRIEKPGYLQKCFDAAQLITKEKSLPYFWRYYYPQSIAEAAAKISRNFHDIELDLLKKNKNYRTEYNTETCTDSLFWPHITIFRECSKCRLRFKWGEKNWGMFYFATEIENYCKPVKCDKYKCFKCHSCSFLIKEFTYLPPYLCLKIEDKHLKKTVGDIISNHLNIEIPLNITPQTASVNSKDDTEMTKISYTLCSFFDQTKAFVRCGSRWFSLDRFTSSFHRESVISWEEMHFYPVTISLECEIILIYRKTGNSQYF